ncbi:hypothetical protein AAVH_30765, partial [Aphelenchoides avenae]
MLAPLIVIASLSLSLADASEAPTFLKCDSVERLVEIQVCDYSNSPYGGVCFYELRQRPFRTNSTDLRSLSNVTVTSLLNHQERELRTSLVSRLTKVEHRPPFEYGMRPISQLVPPYQTLRVGQKMVLCGPYAVPTSEVIPAFDTPRVDRWMLHRPSKKQFYLSSEGVFHSVAERKCKEMHGKLALLNNAEQFNFVASIAVRRAETVTSDGWWTGAVNVKFSGVTLMQWAEGPPQYSIITYPNAETSGCASTLFHLRTFAL